jgi:DNA-binding response OmpR family regulator
MSKGKILIVDDEESIREILQFNLVDEGYNVETASSSEEALQLDIKSFDLLLLDIMMDGLSGIKLAKYLHSQPETENIPVIFITAKDAENDMITGFSVGADDYITKPFSMQIVLARVKSVLKRQKVKNEEGNILQFKDLKLVLDEKRAYIADELIELTKKEYELLYLLLKRKNKILTREEILEEIWEEGIIVMDRTIDVNINRLRNKLLQYSQHIVTRVGYGYVFEE